MSAYNIVILFYYIFFLSHFHHISTVALGTLGSRVRFQVQLTEAVPTWPLHLCIGRQAVGIPRCCISTFPLYVVPIVHSPATCQNSNIEHIASKKMLIS